MQTEKRTRKMPSPGDGNGTDVIASPSAPPDEPVNTGSEAEGVALVSEQAVTQVNDVPALIPVVMLPEAPNRPLHPAGWRLRRRAKRKRLRLSRLRILATDRAGDRALLPMAYGVLSVGIVLVIVFLTASSFVAATQERYGQQTITLHDILPGDNLKLYDMHGQLVYQMLDQGMQTSVPLSQISPHLIQAEISIEDQDFWQNSGYDISGIVRAAIDNLSEGHIVSGGSTITQQLIKNVIVGNRENVLRKLEELTLAPEVSRYYTKEQILDMYLNTSYYGEQAYGADAAAFIYYGLKDTPRASAASQLDIAQAAMLAGIPSAPNGRDPYQHPAAALARMHDVLQHMYLQNYITADQRDRAYEEAQQPGFLHPGVVINNLAPNFAQYALNELAQDLHVRVSDLSRSGLVVSTTLNLQLQQKVQLDAKQHITELAKIHNMSNAAAVVIDYHTGAIRTLVGNIDPNNPNYGQFDVASQGFRQPGSSFKPFIYATAFQEGISPGTPVLDGPLTVQMCCGLPSYTPTNYDMQYHGLITYRYALQNSFNIPAVKLLMQVGVDKSLNTAERMGEGPYEGTPNYTMVLGSLSVHLLDETSAYGVFADHGVRVQQHAIETVKNTQGRLIYQYQPRPVQIISPQVAWIMTNVLSDNASRVFEFGKCSSLFLYSSTMQQCYAGKPGPIRPSAAKTGTSNDFRDNWTVGYTSDYVVGVWAGNNDNSAMVNVTGVDGAGPIWHDAMLFAEQGRPIQNFSGPPAGLVYKTVHYSGLTTSDWYVEKPTK